LIFKHEKSTLNHLKYAQLYEYSGFLNAKKSFGHQAYINSNAKELPETKKHTYTICYFRYTSAALGPRKLDGRGASNPSSLHNSTSCINSATTTAAAVGAPTSVSRRGSAGGILGNGLLARPSAIANNRLEKVHSTYFILIY
jgi:hypothetical protein